MYAQNQVNIDELLRLQIPKVTYVTETPLRNFMRTFGISLAAGGTSFTISFLMTKFLMGIIGIIPAAILAIITAILIGNLVAFALSVLFS